MPRSADSDSAAVRPVAASDPAPSGVMLRFLAALGLLALSAITLAHPSATRLHGWPLAGLVTGLALVPVVAVLAGLGRRATWRLPPAPLLAGALVLAVGGVVSAWLSPFSAASLPRIWPTLGGVALYLWLHHEWSAGDGRAESRRQAAARLLASAGALLAAVSLLLWSRGTWPLPWIDRNTIPFGHSTYTGGAMVLFLPWISLQAWMTRGAARLLWLAAIAAAVVVVASTSSRGAVLALGGVGVAGTVGLWFSGAWSRPKKLLLAAGVLSVGAIVILTNPRLRELVLQRQWGESARESNAQRVAMLDAGWQLGAQRPLTGWGPGSVPLAYPRVRAGLERSPENVLQLHNTPAQLWATLGAWGAAATLLLLAGTVTAVRRAPRTPFSWAASGSLLGYGVVALTDHQLDVPMFAATAAASLALLSGSVRPASASRPLSPRVRLAAGVALAALTASAGPATWADLRARRDYDAALTALGRGDGAGYLRALDDAAKAAPHDPFFAHRAAAWLLEARGATPDAARQTGLVRDAAARLERSLATGVHEEFAHFNLGWLQLDLGEPAAAAGHFLRAARLVPDKGGVYFGLGLAFEAAGRRDEAVRAFALEWVNDPRSATSPAWELPALAALRPAVQAEAGRVFNELRQLHPPATVVGAWARWWWGEPVPIEALRPGFNAGSARFAAELPVLLAGQPLTRGAAPWAAAYAAWSAQGGPEAFLAAAGGDAGFAAALARRARQVRTDFRTFLVAPAGDDAALVRTYRRQRPGYGVLALHPEGPPLVDVHIVQENRVTTDLAAGLFPAKGWLPGRFLLALLPADPR
jgi:tetratricopeptide (TPR) repeat protein